jgi:tRNA-splicing ligase RtcB
MIEITTERIPIKVWAPEDLVDESQGAFDQARNLANHPIAHGWICLMPDFHVGYGMPIGGVLAARGGVVPNAVGVDIGCGMIAARTTLEAASLSRDGLQALRLAIHARVPVGTRHHERRRELSAKLNAAGRDLPVVSAELDRAAFQVGTLGSGNHFIELQRDESDDRVWIMLHSGSRNVGLRVCNHYHGIAKRLSQDDGIELPHIDLAYLPQSHDAYRQYLGEMRWCMEFAEENRRHMFAAVFDALDEVLGSTPAIDVTFDTHHNFAEEERHGGETLLVHRKGAVRAEGLVTIPGSMGTASYIAEGQLSASSFETCSHGAGRVLARKQANRVLTHAQAEESMQHVVFGVRQGEYDEMPACYKDIDAVMSAQEDLVRPVHRLLPLAVVKG